MIQKDIKDNFQEITDNILALSVFFLPLLPAASIICWGLLIIIWIASGQIKNTFINLKSSPALLLPVLLYIFYVAGMLWTSDTDEGFEDLEVKIPLMIFPLLFSSLKFSVTSFKKIYIALVSGCSLAVLICFGHSLKLYAGSGDPQKFFYTSFSFILHPTYFTMYINLALLMLFLGTIAEKGKIFNNKYVHVILIFLLLTGVVLLNARLAMMTTFFTLIIFSILEANKRKKLLKLLPRFIFQAILVAGIFFSLIRYYNRFVQISDVISERKDTTGKLDTGNQIYYNSTLTRMGLFKNGMTVFRNNFFFGVGTGDVKPESVNELRRSKLEYLATHYTGAHDQYLQTAMSLGVFGLILLILCIIFPLRDYFRTKNYLAICFIIIVLINGFGDTILRASPLYFFTFFGCYFYIYNNKFNEAIMT